MAKTKIVEFLGGFHNQMQPIRVRLDASEVAVSPIGALQQNERARRKVMRHLCGIKGCMCGLHHGVRWEVQ
jgi:hypothetical protein